MEEITLKDLINNIYEVQEISDGISNQTSEIKLINTGTKKVNNYSKKLVAFCIIY